MILFLGDSFTWGQGLYFEEWYNNGVSVDTINKHLPPQYDQESLRYSDDLIRKERHFPNLVAHHYDRQYVTKWGNGGSNHDIIHMLKNVTYHMIPDGVDLLVVQFTDFMRDSQNEISQLEKKNGYTETNFQYIMANQINQINNFCSNPYWHHGDSFAPIPWVGFSWRGDMGDYLRVKYPNNYLPLLYNGKEHTNFMELSDENIFINNSIPNCKDQHFNKLGHEMLANSIIKKIDSMNINWKTPNFNI